jgi:hypothetical protein
MDVPPGRFGLVELLNRLSIVLPPATKVFKLFAIVESPAGTFTT